MASNEALYDWHKFKRFMLFALVVVACLVGLGALYRTIFVAFAVSLIFSYVLNPVVSRLTSRMHIARYWVVLLVILVTFGTGLALAAALVPTVYAQLVIIVEQVPTAVVFFNEKLGPLREWLVSKKILSYKSFDDFVINLDLAKKIADGSSNALSQVWTSTPKLLGGMINLALIPLLTWLELSYWQQIKNFFRHIVPRDIKPIAVYNLQKMNFILWGVVKGQLLVALILSFLYMIGFSLIGLPAGLAIGAIAGIFRVIPYFDIVVGASLALLVVLGQGDGLTMIFAVMLVILLVQALDGMIITPKVIGERAGLHPIIVIASVIAFGDWFGMLGILFAVPSVAILFSLIQMAVPYYLNSPFYRGEKS